MTRRDAGRHGGSNTGAQGPALLVHPRHGVSERAMRVVDRGGSFKSHSTRTCRRWIFLSTSRSKKEEGKQTKDEKKGHAGTR